MLYYLVLLIAKVEDIVASTHRPAIRQGSGQKRCGLQPRPLAIMENIACRVNSIKKEVS